MPSLSKLTSQAAFVLAALSILVIFATAMDMIWNMDLLEAIDTELLLTSGVCFFASASYLLVHRLFLGIIGPSTSPKLITVQAKADPEIESFEI